MISYLSPIVDYSNFKKKLMYFSTQLISVTLLDGDGTDQRLKRERLRGHTEDIATRDAGPSRHLRWEKYVEMKY